MASEFADIKSNDSPFDYAKWRGVTSFHTRFNFKISSSKLLSAVNINLFTRFQPCFVYIFCRMLSNLRKCHGFVTFHDHFPLEFALREPKRAKSKWDTSWSRRPVRLTLTVARINFQGNEAKRVKLERIKNFIRRFLFRISKNHISSIWSFSPSKKMNLRSHFVQSSFEGRYNRMIKPGSYTNESHNSLRCITV